MVATAPHAGPKAFAANLGQGGSPALAEALTGQLPSGIQPDDAERLVYLGRMVSAVAHELNNRLTGVIGFADLMSMKKDVASESRLLGKLREHTQNLRCLTEGICGFSVANHAKVASCDVEMLVRQAVELAQCECKAWGIKLQFHAEAETPKRPMVAAEFRLGVFICLDQCARELAGRSGPLTISVSLLRAAGCSEGTRLAIEVQDPDTRSFAPRLEYAVRLLEKQGVWVSDPARSDGSWILGLEFDSDPTARRKKE